MDYNLLLKNPGWFEFSMSIYNFLFVEQIVWSVFGSLDYQGRVRIRTHALIFVSKKVIFPELKVPTPSVLNVK